MSDEIRDLLAKAKAGDHLATGRLLSRVESLGLGVLKYDEFLKPKKPAFRIGITGPPGAGKSTLIGRLLERFLREKLRVAVLAVDPTSPISQGAILGDRIRYMEQATEGVFIRSLATRGSFGGISASAYPMLRALDACGFDVVIIETVGVGQVEVDVMYVADNVVLVLVPESGDSIQAMKAGILEIADDYVVNKADRPGAEALKREIENSVLLNAQNVSTKHFLLCSATENIGIEELAQLQLRRLKSDFAAGRKSPKRLQHEALALLRPQAEMEFRKRVDSVRNVEDLKVLNA